MADQTIWELGIDGSSAIATLDEIGGAIDTLIEKISAFASAASDLNALDDSLAQVSSLSQETTASIDALNVSVGDLSTIMGNSTTAVSALTDTISALDDRLAALAVQEDETTQADAALGNVKEETAAKVATFSDALQGALGPLMIISGLSIMAGKSLFDMGTKAQDSLTQVQALAGVAPADMAKYTAELEAQSLKFGETLDQEGQGLYYVTSAGFQGADAMKVLGQSVEDAKSGHVDLKVSADALTSSLNAYGAGASQAANYNDIMMTAVTQGKQTFSDFAGAIAQAAVTGHSVGISFKQVAAAEATMTQGGFTAQRSTQDLSFLMRALDLDVHTTALHAEKMGLSFNGTAFKSMDLFHQLLYLRDITKGNQEEFSKLVGGKNGLLAANTLLTQNADGTYRFAKNLDGMKNSAGAAANAFQTTQQNISSHMDKVGAALSVFSYKLIEALGPRLIPILDGLASAIGHVADFMTAHMDIMLPVLAALATMFGVIIVGAIIAMIIAMGPVVGIILGVAAGVGIAVGLIVAVIQNWGRIMAWLQGLLAAFGAWFHGLLVTIASFFTSIWNGILTFFHNALTFLVNAGKIAALALFIAFTGPLGLLVLFIVSHWSEVQSWLSNAWHTLVDLAGTIVGNIVNWFQQLPGRALDAVSGLGSMVGGYLECLAGQALAWGANIVNNIAAGIRSAIGAVAGAIGDVTAFISAHLPHSPAKIGPLKDLDYQGSQITEQISQGMLSSLPRLQQAMTQLTQPIALGVTPASFSAGNSSLAGEGQTASLLSQILTVLINIQNRRGGGGSAVTNTINASGTDANQLYNLLQYAQGWNYEQTARGAA